MAATGDDAPLTDADGDALFGPLARSGGPATWVLAVSGGVDSTAMLHLAADWVRRHPAAGITLVVATVDHGLRAESATEAATVASAAEALGLPHVTLPWAGDKPSTGMQAAARAARYRLLQACAEQPPLQPAYVLTAHTADDQAETLLMRLARGSGVDGLAAMRPRRTLPGSAVVHIRPLLAVRRAQLLATLVARGLTWIDDPSNQCDRFERIRIRRLLPQLAATGLDVTAISLSAQRLDRASAALETLTARLWDEVADLHQGAYLTMAREAFDAAPAELQERLLIRAVTVMGADRGEAGGIDLAQIEAVVAALAALDRADLAGRTLHGALVRATAAKISVFREAGRHGLPLLILMPGDRAVWDGRFTIALATDATGPMLVRSLTAAEWSDLRRRLGRSPPLPAVAARTLPSFWRGADLIAVPWFGAVSDALHPDSRHCRAVPITRL